MGRPLGKNILDKIVISATVNNLSSEIPGVVLEQVANDTFVVQTADGTAPCKLTIFPPQAGQARITAYDQNGGTYYIVHAGEKTATVYQGTGTLVPNGASVPWSFGAANGTRLQMNNVDKVTGEGWFNLYGSLSADTKDSANYSGSIAYDSAGNLYMVAGDDTNGVGFLVKYDPSGNILWQKQVYDDSGDFILPGCVVVDGDDYPIAMFINDQNDSFNRGPIIMRFNKTNGNLLVQTQAHPDPNDTLNSVEFWGQGMSYEPGTDTVYVCGWYYSDEKQGTILLKYDSDLDLVWENGIIDSNTTQLNYSQGVTTTSDGNAWVTFSGYNTLSDAPRAYIAEIAPDGSIGHTTSWFSLPEIYLWGWDITNDANDDILVVGTAITPGPEAAMITKFDHSTADPIWFNAYWNESNGNHFYGISTIGTDIYVSGENWRPDELDGQYQMSLARLNSNGEVTWSRGFGSIQDDTYEWYQYASRSLATFNGQNVSTGGYTMVGGSGYSNALVLCTNVNGEPVGQYGIWTYGGFNVIAFTNGPVATDPNVAITTASFNVYVDTGNLTVEDATNQSITTHMP